MADADYFLTRYGSFEAHEEVLRWEPRIAQQVLHTIMAEHEDQNIAIQLFILKCMDAETLVLTADLRWVRLDDVELGDELVAVDEGETLEQIKRRRADRWQKKSKGETTARERSTWAAERRMRTCVVEKKWETRAPAVRLTLDDGRQLVSSLEHRHLSKARGGCNPEWRSAGDFRVGDKVRWVTKPWGQSGYEDGWVGGVIDGEGSIRQKKRAGCEATVSQVFNGVYGRLHNYLTDNGYNFRVEVDTRNPEKGFTSKLGTQDVARVCIGRMEELFRLVGQTRPIRFIEDRWWEDKTMPGRKTGIGWAEIVKIEHLPEQRLIDIQTSTGTFIAEGCVTHNCRQVGISTGVALYFLHRLLFRSNSYAVMASVRQDQSQKIKAIMDACWRRLPFWLGPPKISTRSKEPKWANGSMLSIQSGSQKVGIAQGWSPTAVHISEIADYLNPEKVIDEGLLPACAPYPSLFFVQEGTGGDEDSWMGKKWRYYEENWGKGGRFRTIFIPPSCAKDLYPLPDWIRGNPIPVAWQPMLETERMRDRATLYVRNTDYLAHALGSNWEMTREFMWFWECGYRDAVATHTEKTFIGQMASTPKEAMQGKFDRVFRDETIEVVTREREQDYQAYAVTGRTILIGSDCHPYEPPLDSVDQRKPRIPISWTGSDENRYYWELVPLRPFDDSLDINCHNKLLVFQPPAAGLTRKVNIGIDNAHGLGQVNEDRGALCALAEGLGAERDIELCNFLSVDVNSAQMARVAACIGAWYAPFVDDPRGPKFCIEQVKGPGDDCQNQLKLMGFMWHHGMIFYDRPGIPDPTRAGKEGWYTVKWSRSMMLDRLTEGVNGGWIKVSSPATIRELKALVRAGSSGDSVIDHPTDGHSDECFALGLAHFTGHHLENIASRYMRRYESLQQLAATAELDLRWATLAVRVDQDSDGWEANL